MSKFITVDAKSSHSNFARPTRVNVDAIAFVASAGDQYDPDGPAAITFIGGYGQPSQRLVTDQTADQVSALIAAAAG